MKKRLLSAILCCLIVFSLCGCNSAVKNVKAYDKEHKTKFEQSFIAAQNNDWQLEWDSENYRILLKDKNNGKIWSTLPAEYLEPRYDDAGIKIINPPQLENPLTVEYVDPDTRQLEILYAYTGSLKKGDYFLEKTDSGMKITYYFDKVDISVPVEYKLLEDGINVSVDPTEITEGIVNIYKISLSPFFCSASNTDPSSYLFIPSGSGALVYPHLWNADVSYTCSYPVYGEDLQLESTESSALNNSEPVRLPVFGAKSGDSMVCAIIESGEEAASIDCNVGNKRYGYSSVYASFYLRGISVKKAYSLNIVSSPLSVSFYPLNNESASYVDMANKYREYLEEKGLGKDSRDKALSVKIIGGTYVDEQFIGIPYKSMFAATTVSDTKKILEDIYDNTGIAPVVNLVGFGQSGIDIGKVAGNYKIASELKGNTLSTLKDYCKKINSSLFMDYDVAYFSKSGTGLNTLFDSVSNTVGQRALTYRTEFATGNVSAVKEYLVKRDRLVGVAKKAVDGAKNFEVGISLSTIAQATYSDYSSEKYFCKSNFADDYNSIAEYCDKNKVNMLADNANAYSAINAKVITSAPTQSAKNDLFAEDVPFYQIVFKGYVALTSDAVNLASEAKNQILRSAESGCGLSYMLIKNYDESLLSSSQTSFHACVYDDISNTLKSQVKDYSEYFSAISGAAIKEHYILENGLRKTVFDNGITVYVNYNKNAVMTEAGEIAPQTYIYKKGEVQ